MLNQTAKANPLQDRREHHLYSIRVCAGLIAFFAISLCLLQLSLATGVQYAVDGYARQFALFETAACFIVVAYALLHLTVSGAAWALTVLKMRKPSSSKNRNPATRSDAARRMLTIG